MLAPLSRGRLALALVLSTGWSCTTIIQADWDKAFLSTGSGSGGATAASSTVGSGGATTSSTAGSGGGVADAGPDADAGPTCTTTVASFSATADTILISGQCGANCYGNAEHDSINANIPIRAALRFHLTDTMPALTALQQGTAQKVTLTLTRTHTGGDCSPMCPTQPGNMRIFPLRNDWVEGKGASYDGATWCLRVQPSTTWTSPGADSLGTDHGESAALQPILGTEETLTVTLNASTFGPWIDTTKGELSLLLTPEAGAVYVFAAKEHATLSPPRLDVTYCL